MDSTTLRSPIKALNPRKPITVSRETPVQEAILKLQEKHIGCLCVTDDGNLVGMLTERDIYSKVVAGNLDTRETTVGEVMTYDPEYLFHDDHIAFALNRMHVGGFRHIPLINLKGQPTGLVSIRDILGYLVKDM